MKLFETPMSSNDINQVSNRLYRMVIFAVGALVITNLFWGIELWQISQNADQKVYVRAGKSQFVATLETSSEDRNIHQARAVVETFCKLAYENNAENYRERLNEALVLINAQDGQALVRGFNAEKVLENHVKYNSFSKLQIDSLAVNLNIIPYQCTVLMRQSIIYNGKKVENPIGASFELEPALYSDTNPFGLQINHFNYITYQPKSQ
jgi:type II secretory pathway component PulL